MEALGTVQELYTILKAISGTIIAIGVIFGAVYKIWIKPKMDAAIIGVKDEILPEMRGFKSELEEMINILKEGCKENLNAYDQRLWVKINDKLKEKFETEERIKNLIDENQNNRIIKIEQKMESLTIKE